MAAKKHNFDFYIFQRIKYMIHFPNFKSNSNSLLKKYLTEDVFNTLINKKTKLGYSLAQAINSGLVNSDSSIGSLCGR